MTRRHPQELSHRSRGGTFTSDLETGPLGRDAKLAGEEALGAELLAGRELLAQAGIVFDTLEQMAGLANRQARHLAHDYLTTVSDLARGRGLAEPAAVVTDHFTRRLAHLAEGCVEGATLLNAQSLRAYRVLQNVWLPFQRVIDQDWASREGKRMPDTG